MILFLPGLGETVAREVLVEGSPVASPRIIKRPFSLNESGRLSPTEKSRFVESARSEVIEIGVALTTFADYFHAFDAKLFKDPVRRALQRGVSFKCVTIDPDSEVARVYCHDREEPKYLEEITTTISKLKAVKDEFSRQNLLGCFEMYTYSHLPYYHAMCVDIGEDDPSPNGRMLVSNYLFATKRADTPVIRFSANSNPTLFSTYWNSVRKLLSSCRRLW
jgi:hypothetical protein